MNVNHGMKCNRLENTIKKAKNNPHPQKKNNKNNKTNKKVITVMKIICLVHSDGIMPVINSTYSHARMWDFN